MTMMLLFVARLLLLMPQGSCSWQPTNVPSARISILTTYSQNESSADGSDESSRRRTLDLALAKMAGIGEEEFAARFNKRRMKSVEVKKSSIPGAGLGLFAKAKIKAGTIISFYPAHTLGIDLGDSIQRVSRDASGKTHEQQEGDSDEAYLHHILGKRPLMKADITGDLGGEAIFLDVDMTRKESPGFNGHRINDGATVLSNTEGGVLEYYEASRKAKNCAHVPFGPSPLLASVTTKKVNKGSELFTTYGCSYWLSSLLEGTEEEETDMTEDILLEAKDVAMDVLKGMRSAEVTHASEAEELQAIFDSP
eukprot:CAMPEP_0113560788 /NCGR_PEP_ID=MMETSP0015_2-20120614/19621_1 /TAXON_ID=2838 /ORGANISM="Odontella" /LENGTH=308 /DNA_ID=CAMNT_0000462523 /DNA_START=131 /DNA_END=1057 /DNA_ORIENTATION=- /assembly_acc=CAM_ASM_000160